MNNETLVLVSEAFLTCTHDLHVGYEQKYEKTYHNFSSENNHFTALNYYGLLYGPVIVMLNDIGLTSCCTL